jgi:hypothetical protein
MQYKVILSGAWLWPWEVYLPTNSFAPDAFMFLAPLAHLNPGGFLENPLQHECAAVNKQQQTTKK